MVRRIKIKSKEKRKHIVFFDIDGTLATGKIVPESARRALEILRGNKDPVFICTGRNINYVRNNFNEFADGFITNNGRLAYYDDELIFDAPIDRETMSIIVDRLNKVQAGYVFHTRSHGYYNGPDDLFDLLSENNDDGYLYKGFDDKDDVFYNFDICFYDFDHYEQIKRELEDLCIFNPHGKHHSADVTIKGTDKGDALMAVARKLNVEISDTYAFGDGMNDICMMKAAGHGIAMGNGQDLCKQAAEYITSGIDENGVYNGLKHYRLI